MNIPMPRFDKRNLLVGCLAIVTGVAIILLTRPPVNSSGDGQKGASGNWRTTPIQGRRAMGYLQTLCDFGPRPSGSGAMARQQEFLQKYFETLGGEFRRQEFEIRHPETGASVTLANLIIRFHPAKRERVLLCAHYDTRPYPDRDAKRPKGRFIGANDGASGVAVLMELAQHLPQLNIRWGVDLVLFDGEELVYDDRRDRFFLGSEHFARQYVADYAELKPSERPYRWGVLLDMVGDAQLQIYQEVNSVTWKDTRPLVDEIWATARRIGVNEFLPRPRHEVRDDHLALHDIAGIPACDIIDFDYPRIGGASYWHTEADTPDKCSPESLAKVGAVLWSWLKTASQ
jgi:glutaminyl-peptide cyclotransferase